MTSIENTGGYFLHFGIIEINPFERENNNNLLEEFRAFRRVIIIIIIHYHYYRYQDLKEN